MNRIFLFLACAGMLAAQQRPAGQQRPPMPQRPAMADSPNGDIHYDFSPDSLYKEGVPRGEIRGPFVIPSQAYPGTQHTYWVYVPAQYNPKVPAALMVYQDGQAFKDMEADVHAHVVMDNLIYRREIPVMIGVFINPGRRPDQPEPHLREWGDRTTNRPTEYNSLDDRYARVIVDELLPALQKDYNISSDPERRGIGGSSSGAIAAFTVAWERPNHFRKVLSNVGSFTNLRGGHRYPDIIRESPKKPLRIVMVDGRNDNRALRADGSYDPQRDWFLQNVRMKDALEAKGYDLHYVWGMARHGQKMLRTMFPEMMRWLWRDHGASTDPRDMEERNFLGPPKE
ncbi:MAG: alpha/beta hydrolase-fold protein [Bryobacter sp.]